MCGCVCICGGGKFGKGFFEIKVHLGVCKWVRALVSIRVKKASKACDGGKDVLEIVRVGLFITFSHFEEYPVDGSGDDSTGNRTDPINLNNDLISLTHH